MTRLTFPQQRCLKKLVDGEWISLYNLGETYATCYALKKSGLVKIRKEVGSDFFPRTMTFIRLTTNKIE